MWPTIVTSGLVKNKIISGLFSLISFRNIASITKTYLGVAIWIVAKDYHEFEKVVFATRLSVSIPINLESQIDFMQYSRFFSSTQIVFYSLYPNSLKEKYISLSEGANLLFWSLFLTSLKTPFSLSFVFLSRNFYTSGILLIMEAKPYSSDLPFLLNFVIELMAAAKAWG